MGFKAKHHVNLDGKLFEPGEFLPLAEDRHVVIDQLFEADAIEEVEGGPDFAPAEKALIDHSAAQLAQIAADEGVEVPPKTNKAGVVALIEAKRAEVAAAGAEAGETGESE